MITRLVVKNICFFSLVFFCTKNIKSQETDTVFHLDLKEVIALATDSSIDAFIAQNNYLAQYWIYKNYKAGKLPFMDINSTVADLSRSLNKYFNPETGSLEYFDEQKLESSVNLSLNQNITRTGGKIFIDSDLGRLQNLKEDNAAQYSATIIRVGIQQQLFSFNPDKWEDKINPLQFERAKLELVADYEQIATRAIDYFFMLANAQVDMKIAKRNLANADTLYDIGIKRFKIAAITKDDLFALQLDLVNAQNEIKTAEKNLNRAKMLMSSFLRFKTVINMELVLPDSLPQKEILKERALDLATQYNPEILEIKQKRLEAEREVERAKKDSRLNGTLSASFGLNQSAYQIDDAYRDPLDQEVVGLSLNLPVIDWGLAKGRYNMALRQKEASFLMLDQQLIDLEQNIYSAVEEFNIQQSLITGAQLADSISRVRHEMVIKRFVLGEIDITRLNNAVNARVSAQKSYINALQKYWQYYFNLRKLTLYDFINNKPLVDGFREVYSELED